MVLLTLGAGALGLSVWLQQQDRARPDAGTAVVAALSKEPEPAPLVPTAAATLPSTNADKVVRPVRVELGRLKIEAPVVPAGVAANGEMAIPEDVRTVGWYRFGPGLGEPGSVVVTGHVDSASQGNGAFSALRNADVGDRVEVEGSDGRDYAFRVVGREEPPKATVDLDRYFSDQGKPRLTLITCGGPFDRSTRHYRDNIIVTAVPVAPPN